MKRIHFRHFAAALCACVLVLAAVPSARAAGFRDVPGDHWAYQAILDAAESGLTAGYSDGRFGPGDEVTYAQFTAFLARAFYGRPVQSPSSPWYKTYLDAVSGDGVLSGTAAAGLKDASLKKPINRYDMAQMMYHVIAAKGTLPGESDRKAAGAKLSDWERIPSQYQEAVSSCAAAGLLNGMSDGTFSGSKAMNRAQACAVIARMRQMLGGGSAQAEKPAQTAKTPSMPEARAALLQHINAKRAGKGLQPLTASSALDNAAQALVGEVFQGYYETRPDGRSWATAITDSGFPVDENSSAVQFPVSNCATAQEVIADMAKKADVTADMLDPAYTHLGVGYLPSVGDNRNCWSLLLVRGASAQPAQTAAATPQALSAELVRLINAQRAKSGLKALESLDNLTRAAELRAKDLSGGYIDTRPDGTDWSSVLNTTGVSASFVDESFVVGYRTAADALTIMLNTQSAKEALHNTDYTHVGVGYVQDANGYGGYQDFWSIMYITKSGAPAPSGGGSADLGSLSYTPVPMKDLANKKSLQKKATDEQLAQAYAEAAKMVEPFAGLSLEQKLQAVCEAVRDRFDNGMSYSMETDHYNDPYGYFIQGSASCAGCTRATGLCLNILGIPYEHVHENQYTHQWCRVKVGSEYWICDPYGLYCGPEPAPYVHANPLLN